MTSPGDPSALEHSHDRAAIRRRLAGSRRASYLRDWIYGGIDGAVTTLAVVAGVAGAGLAAEIVVILGIANLVADGFSMAAGNFAGTRAEREEYARLRAVERRHVALVPEGEREEIRQIFAARGLEGATLDAVVEAVSSDEDAWLDTMMIGEYGLAPPARSPLRAAAATLSAFVVCGAVPLLAFVAADSFLVSAATTLVVFFAIGSAKSRWTIRHWWLSGLETLAIGGAAAALAYGAGRLIGPLVGSA